MKRYAIYGSSGYGREVMPVARKQLEKLENEDWELCFVDDDTAANGVNGHGIYTYAQWLSMPAISRHVCIAIANSTVREKLSARCLQDGMQFFSVVAENAVLMDDVMIGEGAILNPFVTITSNVRIGKHFHANLYSYVAHDCVVGDFVTLAPNAHCNGNVTIEDHAYIGTGAILRQGQPGNPLIIGRGAIVGMGAVVTKNVEAGTTVVGNPARVMMRRDI